jgi:pimeloyl-ACP methyl ester carboxylesterase
MGRPPQMRKEEGRPTHERLKEWVDTLRELSGRAPRRYPTIEDAFRRMQEENPHLSPEQARHLTVHGVNQNEDGTYSWKFDNYVRPNAPFGLRGRDTTALWGRITCPTLLVRGTESWASDPATDGRLEYFENARVRNFEGAGHWVHHDRLAEFVAAVREFLAE